MTMTLTNKADYTRHMVRCLLARCQHPARGVDGMKLIQLLAGVMVETVLLFDESDTGLERLYSKLAEHLSCEPQEGPLGEGVLPAAYLLDRDTEHGRAMARRLFEDWHDCTHEFMDLTLFITHQMVVAMEEDGQPRAETFRLLIECTNRALAYEIAAQELCDVVIDHKIGVEGWSMCESISGLSAVAGRSLALSRHGHNMPDNLDKVAYVMTQEAVRLGIPAGTDWRFGLAANDMPTSAPYELIAALEPLCRDLFGLIGLHGHVDQAVACAKAAGRMLALVSGGERPEVEPVIAKPLAMAAMSDTYKTVCREYAIA